jgi:CheY-like chemotaxis protein
MPHLVLAPLERIGPHAAQPGGLQLNYFPCVVGREVGCDVRVCDPMISRRHCSIDWRNGVPVVEDLGSRNGTEVNGKEIDGPRALADGDLLQLGESAFAVRLQAAPPGGTRRRVLVVEDDADAAETLAVLLRGWGHDVEVAGDGARALEAARASPPDTVLLDLHLGDGPDGLEVAHRLRDEAGLRDARVVAVTGHPPEGMGEAEGVGDLDGVLVKPVDAQALRRALVASN